MFLELLSLEINILLPSGSEILNLDMLEVSLIAKFLKSELWFEKSHLIKRELKLIIKNRW